MVMPLMAAILKFGLTSGQSSRQLALRGIRRFVKMSQLLDKVPDVDIDGHGRFKYILVNVQDDVGKTSKKIVRGYARAQWHADIFDEVEEQIKKYAGLQANCLGGGKIEHDPDEKIIRVYGSSQGYGKADHQVSIELLKKKYPDYNITCDEVY